MVECTGCTRASSKVELIYFIDRAESQQHVCLPETSGGPGLERVLEVDLALSEVRLLLAASYIPTVLD